MKRPDRALYLAAGAAALWTLLSFIVTLTDPAAGFADWLALLLQTVFAGAVIWAVMVVFDRFGAVSEEIAFLEDRVSAPKPQPKPAAQAADLQTQGALKTLAARQHAVERAVTLLSELVETRPGDEDPVQPSLPLELHETAEAAEPAMADLPDQPQLPIEAPAEAGAERTEKDWPTIVRALNFPEDEGDREGFIAMQRAARDRGVALLIRAAEDVLNLLSQDGTYMDDLPPAPENPAAWRRLSEGKRGAALGALGGIDDEAMLERTRARMRSDVVMRDAALHFMRRFDLLLKELSGREDDTLLSALGDTRSGRAFILLVQVTGAADG